MIVNKVCPELFEGSALTVTEYVVNACLLSIIIMVPLVRFLECRQVLRLNAGTR